jgi:hypothetical protein
MFRMVAAVLVHLDGPRVGKIGTGIGTDWNAALWHITTAATSTLILVLMSAVAVASPES